MRRDALYHLDSNVIADLSRGREIKVLERMKAVPRACLEVSAIVVGELFVGAAKSDDPRIAAEIHALLTGIRRVPADETVALHYAEIRSALERTGQKMSDNDLWIAATALVNEATLVTANEAFTRVPGLSVENWRV